jgi:iron complex outermembrane recepter protein
MHRLLLSFLLIIVYTNAQAQQTACEIFDKTSNDPLENVNLTVLRTEEKASSDDRGKLKLNLLAKGDKVAISGKNIFPDTLVYPGISPWIVKVNVLNNGQAVVITHHRQKEKLRESPVTMERMSARDIKETPASDFYEGLGYLRGVDVSSASMGFKVINTRGFNSTSPVRSLQLIDGVDNMSPGLNFSLGNFLGASELDIQTADIIVGASSAYYGPNAFNGVVNMVTKDPWKNTGLSAQIKIGERQLGQLMLRYADVIKDKNGKPRFAYKINLSYMRAYDWEASNANPTQDSKAGADNLGGYDAVNRYGDEVFGTASNDQVDNNAKVNSPGLGAYYRDGYWEKDLVNYNTRNLKTSTVLAYKLNDKYNLEYGFNFGTGTTVYQGDNRYSLNDILFFQNRIELKSQTSFLRAYATHEDAGNTYDAVYTAFLMQDYYKKEGDWASDYRNYWQNNFSSKVRRLPGYPTTSPRPGAPNYDSLWYQKQATALANNRDSLMAWHAITRGVANSDKDYQGLGRIDPMYPRYLPGTPEFEALKKEITSRNSYSSDGAAQGSRFFDQSAMYHLAGEKTLVKKENIFRLGFSSRFYTPYSKGTIFLDTGATRITNWEVGIYGGVQKRFWDKKLKVDLTARVDKNQNFNVLFSPAASFVYARTKNNTWRMSMSSAVRNPTLQDQFLYYNVGRAILLGNLNGVENVYEVQDFINYLDTRNRDTLKSTNVAAIRPEQVKTIEVSYKGALAKNRLTLDAGAYFSRYVDFIGYKIVVDAVVDQSTNLLRSAQAYRIATNSKDVVYTYGASVGTNYFFKKHYMVSANWNWNILNRFGSTDPLIPAFNTPAHKVNLGLSGQNFLDKYSKLKKETVMVPSAFGDSMVEDIKFTRNSFASNISFNINWKWVQGFLFEGSPQFTGDVPSYHMLDAQVSKQVPKWNSTIKIGASNLLNNKVFQVYGGPAIGRMAYISLTWEPQGKK